MRGRGARETAGAVPRLHPEVQVPRNLPAQPSSFVGRARELSEVVEALGRTRLMTLTGAGGCGKSRLALRAASEVVESFPDGAWWVELAPVSDPAMVAPTLAQIFGVRPLPGLTELDAVVAYLAPRRALVLLDNCEHVLEEAARAVDALARGCPNVRILSTSRESLRIDGETERRVPSLSLPVTQDAAGDSDAVRLFVERATQVQADFSLTTRNVSAVVRVCRDLEGIPLAIELAAARLRVLSVEQIAEGLSDRFRLLTGGARTALQRHQTLRASVDWSHELLSDAERRLFRRLGVFVGGFTLEAAKEVCAGKGIEPPEVLELLSALVLKSLVQTEEHGDVVRYRLLETMREYALSRLEEADEEDALRDRHRDFYLELTERLGPVAYSGTDRLRMLDPDAANLSQAVEWAADTEPEKALRLCVAAWLWWMARGSFAQGEAAFRRALEAASPDPSVLHARALVSRAGLLIMAGAFEAGASAAQEALAEAEQVGDDGVTSGALWAVGILTLFFDPVGSRSTLQRSRELAVRSGNEFWVVSSTICLAFSYSHQDDHLSARPLFEEVRLLSERSTSEGMLAWYWLGIGWAEYAAGRQDATCAACERARSSARHAGDLVTEVGAVAWLANVDVDAGEPMRALGHLEGMRERALARGGVFVLPWLEEAAARAHAAAGDLAQARALFERIIGDGAGGITNVLARAEIGLAEVLRCLEDLQGAEAAAERGIELAGRIQNRLLVAQAWVVLGRAAATRGEWTTAQRLHHEALSAIVEHAYLRELPAALEALAEVAAGLKSTTEAGRILGAAARARREMVVVAWKHQREEIAALQRRLREALGADAFGEAFAGGEALSLDEAVAYVRRARGERKRPSAGWESLTPTELEVARHAAGGLANPEIAERMFISRSTVKVHLHHIYAKLEIKNRSELAAVVTRRAASPEDVTGT